MVETIISDIGFGFLDGLAADEFDPVAIRIQHKSNIVHTSFSKFLLEFAAQSFKTIASIFQSRNRNADMSKTATIRPSPVELPRIRISRMSFPITIRFLSAPIVSQFQNSFPRKLLFALVECIFSSIVGKEVQRELGFLEIPFLDYTHAEDVAIKFQRQLGILDTEHRVIENVRLWIGRHGLSGK